jgi:hypothetical protein
MKDSPFKIDIPFFGQTIQIDRPQGRNVSYNYLKRHISWRYDMVKSLIGVPSLTSDAMSSMVRKVFEDHGIDWKKPEGQPTKHSGWFDSLVREFGSRGGVKLQKLRKEGQETQTHMKFMVVKKKVAKKTAARSAKKS